MTEAHPQKQLVASRFSVSFSRPLKAMKGNQSYKYELCAFSILVSFRSKDKQTLEKLLIQVPGISGETSSMLTLVIYITK